MKIGGIAGAILLAILGAPAASAFDSTSTDQPKYEREYDTTLAPIGFVDFCRRYPADCAPVNERAERVDLTPERWTLLYQVNSLVNRKIVPVSDQELYGQPEFWTYPTDAGDCEDYLLLKKRYLEALGFPAEALRITVVFDESRQGHAVLTVTGTQGDFVLDNRRNEIRIWSNTGYTFLKRQSASNPLRWLALSKQTPASSGLIAGQNRPRD